MASFADFGVGNGVLNAVSEAFGKDDLEGVQKAVSSGFSILSAIAAFLLLAFFSIYRFVNWGDFFRVVSPQARTEAGPALAVFATCFALNISMDVVQRVQLGLQQGYRYGLWQLCGSTIGLFGVLLGIWLHRSLPVLVMAIAGAPIVATALNAIHFFFILRPELRPRSELVSRGAISKIAKLGGLFFILQLVIAGSFSADNFIVARVLGAVNVPEYSIPQRMFGLIGALLVTLLTPLWPAYSEAIARRDVDWVRHTLYRSLRAAVIVSSIASLSLLLLASKIIHWWVGSRIHPPFFLLLGIAVWSVLESCSNAIGAFLNGAAAVRFQIYVSISFGIACVAAKVFLTRHLGLVAIPWAAVSTCLLVQAVPWVVFIPRFLSTLKDKPAAGDLTFQTDYTFAVPAAENDATRNSCWPFGQGEQRIETGSVENKRR
jgi:O-antigen/teichoic acid export membrane protein